MVKNNFSPFFESSEIRNIKFTTDTIKVYIIDPHVLK